MTRNCREPAACDCLVSGRLIEAHSNAVGERMARYVDRLEGLMSTASPLNLAYCNANDARNATGVEIRKIVAELEGVPSHENVLMSGSLLDVFRDLPTALEVEGIYKLQGDFGGFGIGVNKWIGLTEIPLDSAGKVDIDTVAEAVRGKGRILVCFTFPFTNPGQVETPLAAVNAVLDNNADAIVVLDNAYRRYGLPAELARLAISNERVIYCQTASKDMFLCGARVGWLICSGSTLIRLRTFILPYTLSPTSLRQALAFLKSPEVMAEAFETQAKARDILIEGCRDLGLAFRAGPAPWVLLNFGKDAKWVVTHLEARHGILVQLQTSEHFKGWVRISATVPCEAHSIVEAVRDAANSVTKFRDFLNDVKQNPLVGDLLRHLVDGVLDEHEKARMEAENKEWAPAFPENSYTDPKQKLSGGTIVRLILKCA